MLEKSTQDPRIRTAAASALVAGGALAAAKVVHDHAEERRRERAEAFRFEAHETPREGVGRIARGQLDLTISLLQQTHGQDDGVAVHDARKALKRLRTLLRLSHGAFDDRRFRHENVVLRDIGRALSGTRDAQVLLDTLDALSARYAAGMRDGVWSSLRDSLATAAMQSTTSASNGRGSLLGVLGDTHDRVATWPVPNTGGPESLAAGFETVYRRGRRALRTAQSEPNAETLHELRKRAKDLWYATQLLTPVSPTQMKRLRRDAHHLSDLLGEDHDLTILTENARQQSKLLIPVELELLVALTEHRQRELRRAAMDCAARLYREKPKKLLGRLALA